MAVVTKTADILNFCVSGVCSGFALDVPAYHKSDRMFCTIGSTTQAARRNRFPRAMLREARPLFQ